MLESFPKPQNKKKMQQIKYSILKNNKKFHQKKKNTETFLKLFSAPNIEPKTLKAQTFVH